MTKYKNNKIKAIIWDNFGVLGNIVGGSYRELLVKRLDIPVDDVIRVLTSKQSDILNLGEMSKEEYFDYVIQDLGLSEDKKALLELTSGDICCDWELHAYIGALRDQYVMALLSVKPFYVQELIRSSWPDFESVFDHIIISSEVHLIKPDPRIYRLALDRIGCEPHEAMFIDDSRKNGEGAEKVGIRSILYQNREQVIKELDAILN